MTMLKKVLTLNLIRKPLALLVLTLASATALLAQAPTVLAQTRKSPEPARPVSREALAENFRLFLNRVLPDFNFIKTRVDRIGTWPSPLPSGECDYELIAIHSHFTSGSFDVGPLARQVAQWLKANRPALRQAGFCGVALENDGSLGRTGYDVDEEAADRQRARAERQKASAALENHLVSELSRLEFYDCPSLKRQRDKAKDDLADIEYHLPKWDEMLKKGEIYKDAYDGHTKDLEQHRQKVVTLTNEAKDCQLRIESVRKTLKERYNREPEPAKTRVLARP
jgi:hypothetical protein